MDLSYKASFKKELFRKLLHLPAFFIVLWGYSYKIEVTLILFFCLSTYLLHYIFLNKKIRIPIVSSLINQLQRPYTKVDWAPIYLTLSCLTLIWFFPITSSICGILLIVLCDSLAALIGQRFGKHKIIERKEYSKSYEGSLAFLLSAVISLAVIIPLPQALLLAFTGTFLELLPLRQLDNLIVPLGIALLHSNLF